MVVIMQLLMKTQSKTLATVSPYNTLRLFVGLLLSGLLLILLGNGAQAAPSADSRYIVVLKDTVKDPGAVAREHANNHNAKVHLVYKRALKGYAATLSPGRLNALQNDKRVAFVEADGIATTVATQTGSPWGLDRIDQRLLPLSNSFTYTANGSGVNTYVIDTGIRASHNDFGGRVVGGYDAVDGSLPAADCNGHGTHVAGTVGGAKYGVAKDSNLIAVRVLDCAGSGYWSWIIAGIDYVTSHHQPGQPAVANMSLGGGVSTALDNAVKNSIASGVTYVIAAGNSNADACKSSPARVPEAITIGATDRSDARPSWSNWGSCVDFFAPGVDIASTWHTGDTASNTISGTSMASPHVAGVASQYLQNNPGATPQQVRSALYNKTTKDRVTRARSANDHLLFTNY